MASPADILKRIGLIDATVEDIMKNPKVLAKVLDIVKTAGLESKGCDGVTGNLLYSAAARLKEGSERFRAVLGGYIASGGIKSNPQVRRDACACAPILTAWLAWFCVASWKRRWIT